MSVLFGSFFLHKREIFAYFCLNFQSSYVFNKQNPTYVEFYRKSVSYNENSWVTNFVHWRPVFAEAFFARFSTFFGYKKGPPQTVWTYTSTQRKKCSLWLITYEEASVSLLETYPEIAKELLSAVIDWIPWAHNLGPLIGWEEWNIKSVIFVFLKVWIKYILWLWVTFGYKSWLMSQYI